ncbi:MAG: toll/interleukin-1 receptor domain-containing protein [Chromatiales bacterium]|nr:toll/interleukin-1 receptor domain-containing protein [Chromatiales bacterium]
MTKTKDYWPTEGAQHHNLSRNVIYMDRRIRSFLDGDQYTLVVASKGMGKTLLLRAKKNLLEEDPEGILIIPRNIEYDEPDLRGTLPSKGFAHIRLWEDIWTASIIFSILTHRWNSKDEVNDHIDQIQIHIDGLDIDPSFKRDVLSDIEFRTQNLPSYYLSMILDRSTGAVEKFARSMRQVDELSRKFINSGTSVFIDAFDQTLTAHFSHDIDAWRCGQLGLAKAARKLHNMNHHIKVYASLRQEAWAGFDDDDREAIKGSAIILEYSENDLKKMFEHCIRLYANKKDTAAFMGVKEIRNGWCDVQEKPFSYIFRHSAGTARSLMYIGGALSKLDLDDLSEEENIESIRRCINKVGADNILEDYLLGQRKIFLKTLCTLELITKLIKLLPSNVLTGKSLRSINQEFCKDVGLDMNSSHPFCELYNLGLLGVVERDLASNTEEQHFRKPYEFQWGQIHIVRAESIYLVHPSLLRAISDQRTTFHVNTINVIGSGRAWIRKDGRDGIPLVFLSHSSIDKPVIDEIFPTFEHFMNLSYPCNFWYDAWSIRAGQNIHQEVEKGIEGSDIVLVFISKSSLESGWVEKEWRTKHYEEITSREIQVVPIIIDSTPPEKLPNFLRTKKAPSYYLGDKDSQSRILKQLADDIAHHINTRLCNALERLR